MRPELPVADFAATGISQPECASIPTVTGGNESVALARDSTKRTTREPRMSSSSKVQRETSVQTANRLVPNRTTKRPPFASESMSARRQRRG